LGGHPQLRTPSHRNVQSWHVALETLCTFVPLLTGDAGSCSEQSTVSMKRNMKEQGMKCNAA